MICSHQDTELQTIIKIEDTQESETEEGSSNPVILTFRIA